MVTELAEHGVAPAGQVNTGTAPEPVNELLGVGLAAGELPEITYGSNVMAVPAGAEAARLGAVGPAK